MPGKNSNPYKPKGTGTPTTAPKDPNAPAGTKTGGGSSTTKVPKAPVGSQLGNQGRAAQARQAARQATRIVARSSSTKAGTKAVTKVSAGGMDASYIKKVSKTAAPKQVKRLTNALTKLDSLTDKDSGKTTAAQRRASAVKASKQVSAPKQKKKKKH